MKVFNYFDTEKDLPENWVCRYNKCTDLYSFNTKKFTCHFALKVFPGDCGTLILHGVRNITQEALKIVKDVASKCGYDTVIATYVDINTKEDTAAVTAFRKERWIKAVDGKSNRKHKYEKNRKIVYILHIRNCEHKGY